VPVRPGWPVPWRAPGSTRTSSRRAATPSSSASGGCPERHGLSSCIATSTRSQRRPRVGSSPRRSSPCRSGRSRTCSSFPPSSFLRERQQPAAQPERAHPAGPPLPGYPDHGPAPRGARGVGAGPGRSAVRRMGAGSRGLARASPLPLVGVEDPEGGLIWAPARRFCRAVEQDCDPARTLGAGAAELLPMVPAHRRRPATGALPAWTGYCPWSFDTVQPACERVGGAADSWVSRAAAQASTTGLSSVPSPVISIRTRSPPLRRTGGFRVNPTPAGVPVMTRSPGRRVIFADRNATR
jgi:hypothetical protein